MMLLVLGAVLVLSIIHLTQGGLIQSWDLLSDGITTAEEEDPLQGLKTIQEEAKGDLDRFRLNHALYSNLITGDPDPKNELFPAGDIVSPLANIIENIHVIAVKLINDRIDALEKCNESVERAQNFVTRERKRALCQKLEERYRTECQEIMVKRDSDINEESKVYLEKHDTRLNQKNAEMIRDVRIALLLINQAIESTFSKQLQEFEATYNGNSLPWQVKLDCLETALTVKNNMSAEAEIFANQINYQLRNCHLISATNSTLFKCHWKSKESVNQRLTETKSAADINLGPEFSKAKECVQTYFQDNESPLITVEEGTSKNMLIHSAQEMINVLRFLADRLI